MTGTPVVNDVVKRVGMQLSYEESDDDVVSFLYILYMPLVTYSI